MNATFLWNCSGFRISGAKAGPLRRAMKAIQAREASRQLEFEDVEIGPDEDFELEGVIDENSGLFVDLIVIELGAQLCRVKVEVTNGHFLEHDCGAYFSPDAWNALPSGDLYDRSFVTGKPVILVGKTCTCGRVSSFRDLELIHVEDVCNAEGGDA